MKRKSLVIVIMLLVVMLIGCAKKSNSTSGEESNKVKPELTVAAASDLTKAFTEIGKSFEEKNNCTVTLTFGSTGTQTEQIANGAPFDIFAAANVDNINQLDDEGLIDSDTIQLYALGRIGIVTMKDGKIKATTVEDLLKSDIKKIAIANPDHAPYGLAAKQALVSAGVWDKLESKMVYGKNISETVTLVTTGNAEAGIIALSLKDDETMNFNLIDANLHEPLKQAMAVLKSSEQKELANQFIEYVLSDEGQKIMNKYGFNLPEE